MRVTLANVTIAYNPFFGKKVTAIDDMSFTLEGNTIYGVIGENGAGKTTLLRGLAGLVQPVKGNIDISGIEPHAHRARFMKRCGVLLSGKRSFSPRWTVYDALKYLSLFYEKPMEVAQLTEVFGLSGKEQDLISTLSLGNRQRLSLASAFVNDPDLVLLDEPTLALDSETKERFLRFLRARHEQESKMTIITSHDHKLLGSLVNQVIYLKKGKSVETLQESHDTPNLVIHCSHVDPDFIAKLNALSQNENIPVDIDTEKSTLTFPSTSKNTGLVMALLEDHEIRPLEIYQQTQVEYAYEKHQQENGA